MIKQFGVRLNGTLISPHTDTYPYKAYFETLPNFDREDGETILRPQGWVNALDMAISFEQSSKSDETVKTTGMTENQKASHKLLQEESKIFINDTDDTVHQVQLRFKPHVEPFWISKVLRPGVQMQFQVHFNSPGFWSYRSGTNTNINFRLKETDLDMRFHLCRLRLNSSAYNDLMLTLNNSATIVNYPVVRNELRTFTWDSKQTTRFEEEDIFQECP